VVVVASLEAAASSLESILVGSRSDCTLAVWSSSSKATLIVLLVGDNGRVGATIGKDDEADAATTRSRTAAAALVAVAVATALTRRVQADNCGCVAAKDYHAVVMLGAVLETVLSVPHSTLDTSVLAVSTGAVLLERSSCSLLSLVVQGKSSAFFSSATLPSKSSSVPLISVGCSSVPVLFGAVLSGDAKSSRLIDEGIDTDIRSHELV
jgi:hypothetical protein